MLTFEKKNATNLGFENCNGQVEAQLPGPGFCSPSGVVRLARRRAYNGSAPLGGWAGGGAMDLIFCRDFVFGRDLVLPLMV